MAQQPLYLLFIWHMHQPYYRDPSSGVYRLPWVRLHGIKDYLDMPSLLKEFPRIRQTFNLVPSLLDQLDDYVSGGARDLFLELSRKPATELSHADRFFILKNFFLANWDTMVAPYPRYHQLLLRRGQSPTAATLGELARRLTEEELRDLQVWFNLAWFDPVFRAEPSPLARLVKKGSGFTESEKNEVLDYQMHVLGSIIPNYREMAGQGQIELTTSPYYHPILPLLWNSDVARVAMPWATLPSRFARPEDARTQVARAVEFHERTFGRPSLGMWPSEGSVSQDILPLFPEFGIRWIASDESILAASLGRSLRDGSGGLADPEALYRPYRLAGGTQILFRDHDLSDRIGFTYSRMSARAAAEDFIGYLSFIHRRLPPDRAYAVPVILDGENAWEWFPNDGRDFLAELYRRLSEEPFIRTTTVSEYLEQHPADREIRELHPGSWIHGNFAIWISHEEDNRAWELLRMARETLETLEKENSLSSDQLMKLREHILIAEGSDWCWWYGDEHATENAEEFDELYRENLKQVYRLAGLPIPSALDISVLRRDRTVRPVAEPRAFLRPKIDGEVSGYFEWLAAGMVPLVRGGGAMHESRDAEAFLYFGFDRERLFLRLDPPVPGAQNDSPHRVIFNIAAPLPRRLEIEVSRDGIRASVLRPSDGAWVDSNAAPEAAAREILEVAVLFSDLGVRSGQTLLIFLSVQDDSGEIGHYPGKGLVPITVPTEEFEELMWQ